ncbi:hypothetical protein R3P38DRAFT_3181562 [Favolaschia claudopus]|uniref:Uncharacterized protein n=1 Tax=Favolaschia claudopus TaxID=2862362 RepID=A0AAW0CLU0_9AGAR
MHRGRTYPHPSVVAPAPATLHQAHTRTPPYTPPVFVHHTAYSYPPPPPASAPPAAQPGACSPITVPVPAAAPPHLCSPTRAPAPPLHGPQRIPTFARAPSRVPTPPPPRIRAPSAAPHSTHTSCRRICVCACRSIHTRASRRPPTACILLAPMARNLSRRVPAPAASVPASPQITPLCMLVITRVRRAALTPAPPRRPRLFHSFSAISA